MAVIPTIFDMPDRLQARAMASNNLSNGAIAGIVLGCIFGLALALVVLSICRCGGTFFFIAKRWSRSVTDKAEKVHARANDLYTAGRDRQHQSPKLEDKTHYGDSDLEAGKDPGSSISLAPRINTPPIACVPQEGSETFGQRHLPLRVPQRCGLSIPISSGVSTPPNDEKPVVVDAKRVLDLDDASYLDELPSQTGQGSNATVAPASLPVEDASLEAPKPSSSLRFKEWANSFIHRSEIDRASEVDAKVDCINTMLAGSELKHRRVSELTGFESPHSRTRSTGYSADCSMSVCGAIRGRDWESLEACAGPQIRSSHVDGVNPWDVEYHPNPVIFAHIPASHVPSSTEPKVTYMSDCSSKYHNGPSSLVTITERQPSHAMGLSDTTIQSDNTSVSQPTPAELNRWARNSDYGPVVDISDCAVDVSPNHTTCSDDTLHTWRSDTKDTEEDSSLFTLKSPTSFLDKGKRPCVGSVGTVELINFSASVQPKALANDTKDNNSVVFATSLCLATDCSTGCLSDHSLSGSSPPVESVTTVNSTPPTIPDADNDELPYPCLSCGVGFRTPGLRRNHQNRKHNLRYCCDFCRAKFGLRADLKRHERNVHRSEVQTGSAKLFRCPNQGCMASGMEYARKDNFLRHVERCKKAIAKASSLSGMSSTEYDN